MSHKFSHDQSPLPRCHEVLDKIGHNLSCIRDISEMLASNGVFLRSSYPLIVEVASRLSDVPSMIR